MLLTHIMMQHWSHKNTRYNMDDNMLHMLHMIITNQNHLTHGRLWRLYQQPTNCHSRLNQDLVLNPPMPSNALQYPPP